MAKAAPVVEVDPLDWHALKSGLRCDLPGPIIRDASSAPVAHIRQNFQCDNRRDEIKSARDAYRKSRRHTPAEVVAMIRKYEADRLALWNRQQDAIQTKWLSESLQKIALETLFNEHNEAPNAPSYAFSNLAELKNVKLDPRPETPFERMTDDALLKAVAAGKVANFISDADYNAALAGFERQLAEVEAARPKIDHENWLCAAGLFFFNSASISGHANAIGIATDNQAVKDWCESAGVVPASEAFREYWYKPTILSAVEKLQEVLGYGA